MHSSYSLHIPQQKKAAPRRRKRKIIAIERNAITAFCYVCISCKSKVYFSPGHELVCSQCASRTVEKVRTEPVKRILSAR